MCIVGTFGLITTFWKRIQIMPFNMGVLATSKTASFCKWQFREKARWNFFFELRYVTRGFLHDEKTRAPKTCWNLTFQTALPADLESKNGSMIGDNKCRVARDFQLEGHVVNQAMNQTKATKKKLCSKGRVQGVLKPIIQRSLHVPFGWILILSLWAQRLNNDDNPPTFVAFVILWGVMVLFVFLVFPVFLVSPILVEESTPICWKKCVSSDNRRCLVFWKAAFRSGFWGQWRYRIDWETCTRGCFLK